MPTHPLNTHAHTPTPWKVEPNSYHITDENEWFIIASPLGNNAEKCEANAAHIVHCVNLHDELVEALKQAITDINELRERQEDQGKDTGDWEINLHDFKAVLAKAERGA